MFLPWEHTVLSLFNYIVFVWLVLLVVLRLPLPDSPAKRTLNMAGFKARREIRTAAPDWLDPGHARVTQDTHSSRPEPALHLVLLKHCHRRGHSTAATLQNTRTASSSSCH